MHEILHLSFSAKANHLSTHFFNAQETYFTFDDKISPVDHNISFRAGFGSDGVTETFTPRCLLWDLKGGFGSLKKYNSLYEDKPDPNVSSQVVKIEQPRIPTGDYIKSLDDTNGNLANLTPSSTLFWSDYCNVFHHPRSLLQLSEWEYDPINFPKGRARGSTASSTTANASQTSSVREFNGYDTGVAEFHDKANGENAGEDVLEQHFRALLEECDLISGINVVTEVDSAWGGFTSEALSQLRDDYVLKTPIYVWALEERKIMDRVEQYSKVQTVNALVPLSTLYVPMCLDTNPQLLSKFFGPENGFDSTSNWHTTGLMNAAFESLTLPSRLQAHELRVSMDTLAIEMTSFGTRNIVDGVQLAFGNKKLEIGGTNIIYNAYQSKREQMRALKRTQHTFSQFSVVRDPSGTSDSMGSVWDEYSKHRDIEAGGGIVDKRFLPLDYPQPASYPKYFADKHTLYTSLNSTSTTKYQLGDMKEFVSRFVRTDEREELKDDLENLSTQYEYEWSNPNSDDDDE
ncbi:tubulin domain-containing protein [Lipomyces arxii]|uniref:tubulin domain-containing protein n=1 Tax=Lipomyces arxii TaxID=56418 RepID=UPI0034CF6233